MGVLVSPDLSWKEHIHNLVIKCNRGNGMIKRFVGYHAPNNVELNLYKSLTRSIAEYSATVWTPQNLLSILREDLVMWNTFKALFDTKPEMHIYLNFYVRTHHKDSKKPYVINVLSRWHLAPSEANLTLFIREKLMHLYVLKLKQSCDGNNVCTWTSSILVGVSCVWAIGEKHVTVILLCNFKYLLAFLLHNYI